MKRSVAFLLLLSAIPLAVGIARGQSPALPGSEAHTLALITAALATSPYAGQHQRQIKALSEKEIDDLLNGNGMGLAKAAELNSHPGPLHVLQLARELGLSDAQRAATSALYAEMRERAVAVGRQILEAERALDRAFADGRIDAATLRALVSKIAALQGELRAVHLETHLAQRGLLIATQIARYNALRGYGDNAAPHGKHEHGG